MLISLHLDQKANELLEMNEALESRSNVEEKLPDLEGNGEGSFKFEQSKIQYTRAFLYEISEVEVSCRLPTDFDPLILRELEEAYIGKAESKWISGNSSGDGLLPLCLSNLGLLGERRDSNSLISSKDSQLPKSCDSERSFVPPYSLEECGCAAGILGPNSQKNDLFQLSKCAVPYIPPHCRKVEQHLVSIQKAEGLERNNKPTNVHVTEDVSCNFAGSFSPIHFPHNVLEASIAQESEIKGSDVGSVTNGLLLGDFGIHDFRTTGSSDLQENSGGQTNVIKKMQQPMEASLELGLGSFWISYTSCMENYQSDLVDTTTEKNSFDYMLSHFNIDDSLISTDNESKDSWKNDEGISRTVDSVQFGTIENEELRFDDVWTDVLLQMESKLGQLPISDDTPESEVEISFPGKASLMLADQSYAPNNWNSTPLNDCNDFTSSDSEINLPDEDSLITPEHLIAPYCLVSAVNRDSTEGDIPGTMLHHNLVPNLKQSGDRSVPRNSDIRPFLDISGSVIHRKQQSEFAQTERFGATYIPEWLYFYPPNGQVKYPAQILTPDTTHCIPTLNCYPRPDFHHQTCAKRNTNNSLADDTFLLKQQNQLLMHAESCEPNKKASYPT